MNTTSSVSEILTNINKFLTTGLNKLTKPSCFKTTDLLIVELADLLNPKFHNWYCKTFNNLGREKVLTLAAQAKADGFDKKKLFSHLLKKNLTDKG